MKKKLFNLCDDRITFLGTNPNHVPRSTCESTELSLGAGSEPHSTWLRCDQCDCAKRTSKADRFILWLSKGELARIEADKEVQQ
jgi:hypothetical protein